MPKTQVCVSARARAVSINSRPPFPGPGPITKTNEYLILDIPFVFLISSESGIQSVCCSDNNRHKSFLKINPTLAKVFYF